MDMLKVEIEKLKNKISNLLDDTFDENGEQSAIVDSSVLFLIGNHPDAKDKKPCIVLNKRSKKVRQPGDLCCPGGGISPVLDKWVSSLIKLMMVRRFSPKSFRRQSNGKAKTDRLALMLAAGLREGFEEMRLNPFGITWLGVLPVQRLVMFKKRIYPVVCWINGQKNFNPNWEVEKIVYIPLQNLLRPEHYACYRIKTGINKGRIKNTMDMPCFVHEGEGGKELLWGATFRITQNFLQKVYGFTAPETDTLPVICGALDKTYLTGQS